jgi:hypothetical protein
MMGVRSSHSPAALTMSLKTPMSLHSDCPNGAKSKGKTCPFHKFSFDRAEANSEIGIQDYHSSSRPVEGAVGGSPCSLIVTGSPGTLYSSFTQRPRSTNWQCSEQNGRCGLSCHWTGLLQFGHFMKTIYLSPARFSVAGRGQRLWPLHQNFSPNEIDRTFTAHGVQAHRNAGPSTKPQC